MFLPDAPEGATSRGVLVVAKPGVSSLHWEHQQHRPSTYGYWKQFIQISLMYLFLCVFLGLIYKVGMFLKNTLHLDHSEEQNI